MTALPRILQLRQPARLGIGPGCSLQCAADLARLGARTALIISSASVSAQAEALREACAKEQIAAQVLAGVPAEPSVGDFENILARAKGIARDAVIGLGGGSVLDVAKLIAALGTREPATLRTWFGNGLVPGRSTLLVCIPTTAGAGSEASPNAILYDEQDQLKKAVISPFLVPDATYIDGTLSLGVPAAVTAATGLDALTHCIEAYANRNAHPVVDAWALEGVRLISENLVTAVKDGQRLDARAALAYGSYLGGLCLGPVNTAAVHALAYPLGSRFRLAHGLSNALLLPHVIRFNLNACPQRYATLGQALGCQPSASAEEGALNAARRIEELSHSCGLPSSLREVGVNETHLEVLVTDALKIQRLLTNNPREIGPAEAREIYLNAL